MVPRPSRAAPLWVKTWLSTHSPKQSTPFVMLISTSSLEVAKDRAGQVPRESSTSPDERGL